MHHLIFCPSSVLLSSFLLFSRWQAPFCQMERKVGGWQQEMQRRLPDDRLARKGKAPALGSNQSMRWLRIQLFSSLRHDFAAADETFTSNSATFSLIRTVTTCRRSSQTICGICISSLQKPSPLCDTSPDQPITPSTRSNLANETTNKRALSCVVGTLSLRSR